MLVQAYERELARFDRERALPAWDGLVTSQQAALAQLRVPTMFPTAVKGSREVRAHVASSGVVLLMVSLLLFSPCRACAAAAEGDTGSRGDYGNNTRSLMHLDSC